MNRENAVPSNCRNCLHYKPEGRRGGTCQMFHAPVQSHWKSCSLAALPFIYLLDRVEAEFYGIPDEKEQKVS